MTVDGDRTHQKQGRQPDESNYEWDYGVIAGKGTFDNNRQPSLNHSVSAINITIRDMTIKSFAGDGIFIGDSGITNNVTVTKSIITDNYRNGISILQGTNLYITDNYIDGSMGYWGGGMAVDVEAERDNGNVAENVYIQNNRYKGVITSRYCTGRCVNIVINGNIKQ